ncbi:LEAF RUST 10 DISEASE-RESISTANCE LOCUS RECEPTOR-LIKE PROTEIN KINASE-like 1.1 [Mangifera indica]|uniref:LEAF RUST 10 DISEASE-RESISTANCE LOCUS RECEPTOR-LIKE PROTEIN KINASE-like 1.1 n=1 Tax=Mangifera indica TaxID=29780 RepID=UPI001CFB167B|nr:LEAF RUST 10 DISEASE-RESISTANCE LOCUS RECEPTOR-LIKE PROTEIN KINASE-like 1.1 [Mangifera indica]
MAHISYVLTFLLSVLFLLLLCLAQEDRRLNIPRCPRFRCGFLGNIGFPFSNRTHRECGLLVVDNCTEPFPRIQLGKKGQWFNITGISQDNTLELQDKNPKEEFQKCSRKSLENLTLPISPFLSFDVPHQQAAFECPLNYTIPKNFTSVCNNSQHFVIVCRGPTNCFPGSLPGCSQLKLQMKTTKTSIEYSNLFTGFFSVEVNVTDECYDCFLAGGQCKTDSNGNFNCSVAGRTNSSGITTYGEVLGLIPGCHISCFSILHNDFFVVIFYLVNFIDLNEVH